MGGARLNRAALALTLTAAGLLLVGSNASARGQVEAGEGGAGFGLDNLADTLETTLNQTTQAFTMNTTDTTTAARNVAAFLAMIQRAEGTSAAGRDPYRVCYGYRHTIGNMRDHPAVTGEWRGERLPDATVHHPIQCVAMAGLKSGRIDEDVLGIRLGEDAHDAVPGRLRALRDNADFLAYQLVQ